MAIHARDNQQAGKSCKGSILFLSIVYKVFDFLKFFQQNRLPKVHQASKGHQDDESMRKNKDLLKLFYR